MKPVTESILLDLISAMLAVKWVRFFFCHQCTSSNNSESIAAISIDMTPMHAEQSFSPGYPPITNLILAGIS